MSAGGPRPEPVSEATFRRRRQVAAAIGVAIVLAIGLALALFGFRRSGSQTPHAKLPGPGVNSVITPAAPTPNRARPGPSKTFAPSPAAVAAAARLPLTLQVAQLFLVAVDGRSPTAGRAVGGQGWGGFVLERSNFSSDRQLAELTAALTSSARDAGRVAPLLAAKQAGGPDTAFPDVPPQGEAAIGAGGTPEIARRQALLAGQQLRVLGFSMTLAPLADVDTPGGALTGRLFSTDPATVASFSAAAVSGYDEARVISAPAHFPGSGGASADPDQATASVGGSLAQLRARDLIPFSAVAALAPVITMSNAAYVAFDGVTPASLLSSAVNLLRDQLGFQGVVMSDDLDATLQPTGQGPGAVAVEAVRAGDNLLYLSGPAGEQQAAYSAVLAAAQRSPSDRALIHAALLRDLSLKARYGLLR